MFETISRSRKPRGEIKEIPEDFIVEEITESFKTLRVDTKVDVGDAGYNDPNPQNNRRFCVFVMQKRGWNTAQALKAIANRFGRGQGSVGFAGTKDRRAVTTQLCSIYGVSAAQLYGMDIKDIRINGAWESGSHVRVGELAGNEFGIRFRELESGIDIDGYGYDTFPNYFGPQRFGFRGNNVSIGVNILRGDFEGAVMEFLTSTRNETDTESVEARTRLERERDFSEALRYFPGYLKYERTLIDYLSRHPGDYSNAIRKLPRQLTMMFIHSVEGEIFNSVLSERVRDMELEPLHNDIVCGSNGFGFPDYNNIHRYDGRAGVRGRFIVGRVIGYDTDEVGDRERDEMDRLGISLNSFRMPEVPEIRCGGGFRVLFAPVKGLSYTDETETMRFALPSGSYATVLLNEFIRTEENKVLEAPRPGVGPESQA